MSESSSSTRFLEELTIGDPISQHHGIKCCPAIRESTDERYIVKILSIPASQVQLDALLLTGAYQTPAHALEYFHNLAEDVLREVQILDRLHAMEGFLPFSHAEIREAEDGIGYQVYLISPYRRSLERQMQLQPLTHLGAVNLGLDLCAALALCRRAGYLYLDLKPSNIYVLPNQGYRIGDLGFLSMNSLKYASFPDQYRSPYTAPEISDAMSPLNTSMDVFAVGLILYQVYNNGELPAEAGSILPPPAYADYEMAEIILKACHPDPAVRWSDPLKMGQAIVAYMQRNSVNDTPIVPPPVEIPEEAEAAQPEDTDEADAAENPPASEQAEDPDTENGTDHEERPPEEDGSTDTEPELDLDFMEEETQDETLPSEENAADITDDMVSDEVQEMLARADELITHELPEPAVSPDPVDVPFPAPITLPEDAEGTETAEEAAAEEVTEEEASEEDTPADAPPSDEASAGEEAPASEETEPEDEDDTDWGILSAGYRDSEQPSDEKDTEDRAPRKRGKKLAVFAVCTALLAVLITAGILFYQYFYLQQIDSLQIDGSVDTLTVVIHSSVADDLLTAVCTDTYGITRIQGVVNGTAHFTGLTPDTQYRVQVNISGFHQLEGVTSGSYTTAAQTEILNFNAVAGPEDGSVVLSFSVNGPDADTWTIGYATEDAPETTASFSGHAITVTGLTVGSEYLFRLIPNEGQYLTGTWEIDYTAQQIVYAENLSVQSCGEGKLVAVWTVPEGLTAQGWNVRCYNQAGYDQTLTTTEMQVQFENLDHSQGYTVEVTALGMTQSATATVTANPITITDLKVSSEKDNLLTLDWTYMGEPPAEGWILDYAIDGGAVITLSCPENTAQITRYPGSKYEIHVRPVGEVTCFGGHLSHEAAQAKNFSGYNVKASDMSFYMCLTPDKENWDRYDVPRSDYTTSFKTGEKASFLVELRKSPKKTKDTVTITFVIRTKDGAPVSLNSIQRNWKKMWSKKFCELDIPQMPETAGEYTVDIYINGEKINKKDLNFKIT